ncbi:MAG TPA: multicopper oxidase domain-containing protein [Ktedonobacterales bacterium]|jgi:FtsP/CotA-like multicopper oxidase with cupredoxin domain|nr:multicopper oxidase domain-containing protein [Ktedonobacterales bacterium]
MTTNDTKSAVLDTPAATGEAVGDAPMRASAGSPPIATDSRAAWTVSLWDERLWKRLTLPLTLIVVVAIALAGSVGFAMGQFIHGGSTNGSTATQSSSSSSSSGSMNMGSSSSSGATASVPDATQPYGNQPLAYTVDPDGAKHFTMTAQQVMWSPVKGAKVLAWTLNGTVPGPMIHVTAGDKIRITIVNHLPEATSIHWHGFEVPTDTDGVPPLGQKPIQPGKSYDYSFTILDSDAGTHWYHSHYDDLTQVGGGMYGAFIVDPRPGSAQAALEPKVDVDQVEMISQLSGYYMINGKSFPNTQPIVVSHGQTVRLRLIGADTMFMHPMHLHGHTFNVIATDGHMLTAPYMKDTLPVAPGETYDVTFTAWAAPGSVYPFHCHILTHLMNPGQTGSEMGGLVQLLEYKK